MIEEQQIMFVKAKRFQYHQKKYIPLKKADLKTLSELIQKLSALVTDFPEIKELDMNPVLVMEQGKGCKILDIRIGLS